MPEKINRRTFFARGTCAGLGLGLMPGSLWACTASGIYTPSEIKKGAKQLFVDDLMIARLQGIERKVHPAQKLEHPVLEADMPWEQGDDYNGKKDRRVYIYGTVMRDNETGKFRMWYNRLKNNYYAVSDNGINWERPVIGQLGDNNMIGLFHFHSPSIIYDKFETDPAKRYKAVGSVKGTVGSGELNLLREKHKNFSWYNKQSAYSAAYSADGLNWKLYPHPIIMGGDTITLVQDPLTGEYLAFHKNKTSENDKERESIPFGKLRYAKLDRTGIGDGSRRNRPSICQEAGRRDTFRVLQYVGIPLWQPMAGAGYPFQAHRAAKGKRAGTK